MQPCYTPVILFLSYLFTNCRGDTISCVPIQPQAFNQYSVANAGRLISSLLPNIMAAMSDCFLSFQSSCLLPKIRCLQYL